MRRRSLLLLAGIFSTLPTPGEECKGRTLLKEKFGSLSDGEDYYPSYARCEWLIDAQDPNKSIYLEFEYLNTECSYDFLFIYDGDSYNDPMLASLSGNVLPSPILASSGKMLVYLFSDRNYERNGFKAKYSIQDCPLNCSYRGNCNEYKCYCDNGYTGLSCQREQCPNNCSLHGHCVEEEHTAFCQCNPGYGGYMCNISLNDSEGSEYWYELAPSGSGLGPRSAHAGALLTQPNCLYIFGGFSLNEILSDLKRFCFESNKWENINKSDLWPDGRYEHAIVQYENGFYMFGGIIGDGLYSNELWYFNATTVSWIRCAENSIVVPLKLSGHTLTLVEDELYVFGGKTNDGFFWANMYKISAHFPDQWIEIIPLGGKQSLRRLVGHSTVYHKESKSLLIYGGYSHSQDQPRFGSHTNNLHVFHVENKIWSQLNIADKSNVPNQRSFHTAQIMGNYMVIYGGNTHIHHDVELCYDFDIYLYHLGCHTWINIKHMMGKYSEHSTSLHNQGRVSHVAVAMNGNILVVAGGYSGYVKEDLIAFKFPAFIAPPASEMGLDLDYCANYTRKEKCDYNPECFYCNNISNMNKEGCLHKSSLNLCTGTMTVYPKELCPGICGHLKTCLECLSQGQGASRTDVSPERRIYIEPCNWCVKEAQCQQRSKPEKTCQSMYSTETGLPGWWNGLSASLSQIEQCRLEDFPAGLQAVKYRPLINLTYPDEVTLIKQTVETEMFRHIYVRKQFFDKTRWIGFVHPLNASTKVVEPYMRYTYMLKLVADKIAVTAKLGKTPNTTETEDIAVIDRKEISEKKKAFKEIEYFQDRTPIFSNRFRGNKYYVDVEGQHQYPKYSEQMVVGTKMYNIDLEWNGRTNDETTKQVKNMRNFSFEFLEPYSNGSCRQLSNCQACMLDNLCGWCEPENLCVLRSINATQCIGANMTKLLITEPSMCPSCSDHVECQSCSQDPRCEWVMDFVYCVRRGREEEDHVVRQPQKCPPTCHVRTTCSMCLNISECAWCENLRTCLPFSDYVSRHRHGQCTEWIDSEVASSNNPYTCRNCSSLRSCDQCLKTFNCGWCSNAANPTLGICLEGDFSGPYGNDTCSELVSTIHKHLSQDQPTDWSYSACPDVNECDLGMAKCHQNATCTNTPTAYNCTCNKGFDGDGRKVCTKMCSHVCFPHGQCIQMEDHEYICDCDLGWTGDDCATDCKCNWHSMCENGTGKCDYCLNGTTGPHCDICITGKYGDPTKPDGCFQCQCNDHGNVTKGQCNNKTGECYCLDNTEGYQCEKCQKGYYGDPRGGGKCYLSCDHGLMVENITQGWLGSYEGAGVTSWRAYCLWILNVSSDTAGIGQWTLKKPPTITFVIEDLAVECERDHVYVYDGIPQFIDSSGKGELLGAFCGFHAKEQYRVLAHSGIVTVYFNSDISGNYSSTKGFNGGYHVNKCTEQCEVTRHQYCDISNCTCIDGYTGYPNCSQKMCTSGCHFLQDNNSCLCESHLGYTTISISTYPWSLMIGADLSGPIGRYGHVLIQCDNNIIYLFGGMSHKLGLLNDIWQYNISSNTWTEIRPISHDRPSPRYYHAGACVPYMKNLYIFGGLVTTLDDQPQYKASKEMWKFAIDAGKWTGPIEPDWVLPLAGHSMTLVSGTKLVIIGGFSTSNYFNDIVYIFDANSYLQGWKTHKTENKTGAKPTGIYGHSAIYNEPSKTIYLFGGHVYRDEKLLVSEYLFTYDVSDHSWNILQPENRSVVEPRYFHSAIGFDDYMVIVGGYTHHRNTSNNLLVYKYKCNFWLTVDLKGNPLGAHLTSLVSASVVKYSKSAYIFGGLDGVTNGVMYQLTMPEDNCSIHNTTDAYQLGCTSITFTDEYHQSVSRWYTADKMPVSFGATKNIMNTTLTCNSNWYRTRRCGNIVNCSECVAVNPQFKSDGPSCFWCGNCRVGKCVRAGYTCDASADCKVIPISNTSLIPLSTCPIMPCVASTCAKCQELNCVWLSHFQLLSMQGDISRQRSLNQNSNSEWTCIQPILAINLPYSKSCKPACYDLKTCKDCLNSTGIEGGSKQCYWSDTLQECLPPAYLSLYCLGGVCGTILQGLSDRCPVPCSTHSKCADCRRAQGCGWCAYSGDNGRGTCMAGTRSGPFEKDVCGKVKKNNNEKTTDVDRRHDWAYAKCPPEDECQNGHHNCDLKTQDCNDQLDGFKCACKQGYILSEEDKKELCKPVCHQGCVSGICVKPDSCQCTFGFIGHNCSSKCECNGHSNCESIQRKDTCLECVNNTKGENCEFCKALFVGDPKNGGRCMSCTDFCNNHSDVCMLVDDLSIHLNKIQELLKTYNDTKSPAFIREFSSLIKTVGPDQKNNTRCVECKDNTQGYKCDKCKPGYFRLPYMTATEPCIKCMCNGHSDMCDSDGGLNCRCQNNTETKCNYSDVKGELSCQNKQCAECKEYFLGEPTNGHHCYRTMTINKDYCFDPQTQAECTRSPEALHLGRTVFFVVQPKYVNVNIRVTVDVTVGGIDVYFSPHDNTFIVNVDDRKFHHVQLDLKKNYQSSRRKRSMENISIVGEPKISEIIAKDVNTFITVDDPETVLIVRNLKSRLVITLPNDKLVLKTSRFYMIFLGAGDTGTNESFGNVFFRQDQPHIDLFVFFSVFFSCFFLFLALCVLLWKTKQGFDARRTQQQHAREMLHMASRPFAKVLVHIEHLNKPINISPNLRNRNRKVNDRTPLLQGEANTRLLPIVGRDHFEIVPIAVEPVDDGIAAIGTVVLQLPGGIHATSQLCLGSALTCQIGQNVVKFRKHPTSSAC